MQGCRALPGVRTHTLRRHGGGARRLTQQLSAHGEVLDGPDLLADIHRDVALRHPLALLRLDLAVRRGRGAVLDREPPQEAMAGGAGAGRKSS